MDGGGREKKIKNEKCRRKSWIKRSRGIKEGEKKRRREREKKKRG